MDFRTACEETKTGICLLQDGNQEPFKVRLHLAKDILMIQEQDVICVSGEPFYSGERTVTIRRQTVGGFGLSIKGGAEHNIPVVISKISKEQRAELSGLLFIGDAILQINGINVRKCRHEEVVQVLRNAGEEVTLTVSFLKRAPAFLKLPLNEDCACAPSDQSSGTSSPLCDSGLHLNYHPNNTDTLSCSSWPASPGLRWEKRWSDLRLIPLLHSRCSQYVPGTDASRQNAFQVIAVDGVCSGILQCLSAEEWIDWLQAIATNISNLTKHNVSSDSRNAWLWSFSASVTFFNMHVTLHQLLGVPLRMSQFTSIMKALLEHLELGEEIIPVTRRDGESGSLLC
ncbi:PREDICTED: gamma-1-syntrophin-like [Galeopterus variegatus]|uniref:Gamma-1-syntrophin-like n=1 Tax=Galeopterus variegatus TaxID=482537 RepID=A0ABM0RPY8_GALVR|nr:PREDICTED: gamma-1-syntrophin-like [Galeopterus variegatus]